MCQGLLLIRETLVGKMSLAGEANVVREAHSLGTHLGAGGKQRASKAPDVEFGAVIQCRALSSLATLGAVLSHTRS